VKIWIVTIGEPVPIGVGTEDRLDRSGALARALAERGHQVLWWTSAFSHIRKQFIDSPSCVQINPNLRIRLLRGCGYRKNISLSRFIDHRQIARKFRVEARAEIQPDIVITALPTVELCLESVKYGSDSGIPVVLDMRDMWPDIFVDAVPRAARPIARFLFEPMFRQARQACARATAITGITDTFVEWGLQRGGRARGSLDVSFPLSHETTSPTLEQIEEARKFWTQQGITPNNPVATICYFGNVNRQLDLLHVIEAARILNSENVPVQFVLCGKGERLKDYSAAAAGLPNVILPGWVNQAQMTVLMSYSTAGLDPLPDRYDFLATINNKAIIYLSAGLPVISSPRTGTLFELLARHQCGVSYDPLDSRSLAAIVTNFLDDTRAYHQMGFNARRLYQERFSPEKVLDSMAEYLLQVESSGSATANVEKVMCAW
jgi:glycosyltransferase involved in cell wall biosynthesis